MTAVGEARRVLSILQRQGKHIGSWNLALYKCCGLTYIQYRECNIRVLLRGIHVPHAHKELRDKFALAYFWMVLNAVPFMPAKTNSCGLRLGISWVCCAPSKIQILRGRFGLIG